MNKLNTKNVALSLGITFSVFHTLGVLLLQAGFLSYWNWAHLASVQIEVQAFSLMPFLAGIATAFAAGCIVGMVFSKIYNNVSKK